MITIDQITEKVKKRFWSKVQKGDGCWLWQGKKATAGYGIMSFGPHGERQYTGTHRISWLIHRGEIPEGLFVCHKCDVRDCVNPDHLFVGTQQDNADDARIKGRLAHGDRHWCHHDPKRGSRPVVEWIKLHRQDRNGEGNPAAKLTDDQVREIRLRYIPHVLGVLKLSREYGVCGDTIWKIVTRKKWVHVV